MPPSQSRSKRSSAPSQDAHAENQRKIKIAKKTSDIKHTFADEEALEALQAKVTGLPALDQCKKLNHEEMSECVVEVMRHMLAFNQAKPMVPVATSVISKLLKDLNSRAVGTTKPVMARARVRFLGLGWDLVEVGTGYVLRSIVPVEFRTKHLLSQQEIRMHGVRLLVSMYLHTHGGKANADTLKSFLEKFGLHVGLTKQHPMSTADLRENRSEFGTENPIQLLVDQKFLRKVADKDLDGGTDEVYSLGDAQTGAVRECSEEDMQTHLKDLMAV